MISFYDILSGKVIDLKPYHVESIKHGIEAIKIVDTDGTLYLASEINIK